MVAAGYAGPEYGYGNARQRQLHCSGGIQLFKSIICARVIGKGYRAVVIYSEPGSNRIPWTIQKHCRQESNNVAQCSAWRATNVPLC